jgi:excisionase family DNA binding protein
MAQVEQTSRVIQMLLDMLQSADRQLVLQQLNKEHGLRVDVARLYSDKEMAERYDVHVRTVRMWIANGRLTGCQIAGRWYSRADWMDEFEQKSTIKKREEVQIG